MKPTDKWRQNAKKQKEKAKLAEVASDLNDIEDQVNKTEELKNLPEPVGDASQRDSYTNKAFVALPEDVQTTNV